MALVAEEDKDLFPGKFFLRIFLVVGNKPINATRSRAAGEGHSESTVRLNGASRTAYEFICGRAIEGADVRDDFDFWWEHFLCSLCRPLQGLGPSLPSYPQLALWATGNDRQLRWLCPPFGSPQGRLFGGLRAIILLRPVARGPRCLERSELRPASRLCRWR